MIGARTDRLLMLGGIMVSVAILAASWFFLVSPRLADGSQLDDQTSAAQDQATVLQTRLGQLRRESLQLPALKQRFEAAQAALPSDNGMTDFLRQVGRQAGAAGLSIGSVLAGAPAPAGHAPGTAPPPAGAGAPAAAGTSGAVAGSVFAIPVTITATGPADRQQQFLKALQHDGPRTALVSSVQLAPAGTAAAGSIDAGSTLTVQLQIFVAPAAPTR